MYFEIYQEQAGLISASQGQWRWRLRAANNKIICSAEGYHNRQDCEHAIEIVKNTSADTPVMQR